jgi:hypothetical protein
VKHLQSFSLFEARKTSDLTQKQKTFLTKYTQGTWSVNRQTGLVDVEGDFDCSYSGLRSLSGISFGHVSGNFSCAGNDLTSLAGAPQTVGGYFSCDNNQLTSLVGAPQTVCGSFFCQGNHLTSLAGAPQTVGGVFDCSGNQLTTLAGAPQKVNRSFGCSGNRLISLAGAPQTVGGNFYCDNNQLTSLVGAPQTVGRDFWCSHNRLTTLVGAPQTVGGYFFCDSFKLRSGEWNPQGWLAILATGDRKARRLIVTLPMFDAGFWLQKLKGDLKKDGQVLLQLADLWDKSGWEEQRQEIEQRLSPEQLRVIKALKTKLGYVNPWKDFDGIV